MTGAFDYRVEHEGRRLLVTWGTDEVARFEFAVPGDGGTYDAFEGELATQVGPLAVTLRHDPLDEGWRSLVTVDNLAEEPVALAPVGMGVTVRKGWVGSLWTTDLEGLVVVSHQWANGPSLVVRLSGFARAASSVPVFTPQDRRPDPSLPSSYAALHLANPTGSLRGAARTRTSLTFLTAGSREYAEQFLPAWLPELVVDERDEIVFNTPDQAVVGGPGVTVQTLGNAAVVTGEAGHREIAFHDVLGVRRLRASFAPDAKGPWLGEVAAGLMRTRPSAAPSPSGAIIAAALNHGVAQDPSATLDWLERVDWLDRDDVHAMSVSATLALWNRDRRLAEDTWSAAQTLPAVRGTGMVLSHCAAAMVHVGGVDPARRARRRAGDDNDAWYRLERALLAGSGPSPDLIELVEAALRRLGSDLPGGPMRLSEGDAGFLIAILDLVPTTWVRGDVGDRLGGLRRAVDRARRLLLTDHASGLHTSHEGLAWVLRTL